VGSNEAYFTTGQNDTGDRIYIDYEKNEIMSLVNHFSLKPSFDSTLITDMYKDEIFNSINKYYDVKDADKQYWMRSFNYENLCKSMTMLPIKNAIKRYKIENTYRIYSLPYQKVYKVLGKYCDQDYYVNGTITDVQKEFISKMRK
jgi:hypothetical protein